MENEKMTFEDWCEIVNSESPYGFEDWELKGMHSDGWTPDNAINHGENLLDTIMFGDGDY